MSSSPEFSENTGQEGRVTDGKGQDGRGVMVRERGRGTDGEGQEGRGTDGEGQEGRGTDEEGRRERDRRGGLMRRGRRGGD